MSISSRRMLKSAGGAVMPLESNVLLGKMFTSQTASVAGYELYYLTDGDDTSRWISDTLSPVTITTDMGTTYALSEIRIDWAGNTTKNYEIALSPDGTNWTTIYSGVTTNQAREMAIITNFSGTPQGRYFRLVALDRWNEVYGNSIHEIEAQGVPNGGPFGHISNFSGAVQGTTAVDLTWAYSGSTLGSYTLERDGLTLAALGSGATSYTDSTVSEGSTYEYSIRGNYSAGGSTAVATTSVSVNSGDGLFRIVGTQILDPSGAQFWPKGANTTLPGHFTGDCRGHSGDAAAWGWNMVRLCIYATSRHSWSVRAQRGYSAVTSEIDQVVQEYTAAGIVVMIQAHDFTGALDNPAQISSAIFTEMSQFWVDMANTYKNNTHVWLNPVNEPCWSSNTNWYTYNRQYLQSIRAQGAQNVVVLDTMNMGQDAAWDGAKRTYDPTMGAAVKSGYSDVVFAVHAYGADSTSGSAAALTTYSDNMDAAGLCYLFGEFGHTMNGTSTAGTYAQNVNGVNSVLAVAPGRKIGMLWWHGEHNDYYSLKSSGGAYYSGGSPSASLSTAGQSFWNACH